MNTGSLCSDFCFIVYLLGMVVSISGAILFTMWWWMNTKASEVYIYVMLLFYAFTFNFVMTGYARYSFINDPDGYVDILNHPLWHFRVVPIVILLGAIVVRMWQRMVKTMKEWDEEKKGET